jgi:hemolysin III
MSWLEFREPFCSWSHAAWMLLSLAGTFWLWYLSRGDWVKQLGLLVFGFSLTVCAAGSTLYHAVCLPETEIAWFAKIDFIGIYLLIAGTMTPLALVLLRGRSRWTSLALVWLVAATGIVLRLADVQLSRLASLSLYLGMGWLVVPFYADLARALSRRAVRPVLLGGLLYSVGAVLNFLRWPALWPGVFSAHELWHLFVMAGSLCHFWLMLKVVVPFQRLEMAADSMDVSTSPEDVNLEVVG